MSQPLLADLAGALALGAVRVVDLTQPLSERTPVPQLPEPFVNTPGLSRRELSRYDDRGPAWADRHAELRPGRPADLPPLGGPLATLSRRARAGAADPRPLGRSNGI